MDLIDTLMIQEFTFFEVKQCGRVNFSHLHLQQGYPLLPLLIVVQPPLLFPCYRRQPSHHPFNLTSVYLVPALHLLPPTTLFTPYGTLSFSLRFQTTLTLTIWSTLPANSLSSHALHRTSSFLTLSIRVTSTLLLELFISRTFTLLLSALLILHVYVPYSHLVKCVCTLYGSGRATTASSYRHFFAFMPNHQFFSTLFSPFNP